MIEEGEEMRYKTYNRLRQARLKKGYSIGELAGISGVNQRMIGKYENGEKDIDSARLETLVKLSFALECRISSIINNDTLRKALSELEG